MHDSAGIVLIAPKVMRVGQTITNLHHHLNGLGCVQVFEPVCECAGQVGHNDVGCVVGREEVKDFDDVGMPELARDARFLLKAFEHRPGVAETGGRLGVEFFDCYVAFELEVMGQVYDAEAAAAYYVFDFVAVF